MNLDAAPRVLCNFGIYRFANIDDGRRRFLHFAVPDIFTDEDEQQLWACLENGTTREDWRRIGAAVEGIFARTREAIRARNGPDG
jgi:hypothetical protein